MAYFFVSAEVIHQCFFRPSKAYAYMPNSSDHFYRNHQSRIVIGISDGMRVCVRLSHGWFSCVMCSFFLSLFFSLVFYPNSDDK